MKQWRFIISGEADGPVNMSIDEALFLSSVKAPESLPPLLRVYTWKAPCMTIGYFQKHGEFAGGGLTVTRRMTGGLSVAHGHDLSYCFIASDAFWPHVYDQEKSYALLHAGICRAVELLGEAPELYREAAGPAAGSSEGFRSLCVKTLYPHDVRLKGEKIVGSCQRRRGRVVLQQGSIHLPPERYGRERFVKALRQGWEEKLKIVLAETALTGEEEAAADVLTRDKYAADEWNKKY